MLSLTVANTPKPLSLSSNTFLTPHPLLSTPLRRHHLHHHKPLLSKPISATIIPSSPNPSQLQQELYQPYRPPPSPLPSKYRSLDTNGRLDILTNRLGAWFEYAPLITFLIRDGFHPTTLEELTGVSCIEQNQLVVAAQVRESLIQSEIDPESLSFFDNGGAEILYEIRLLSASQRAAVARYLVENKLDGKGAQELARAIKDFPRRMGDKGWESFNYVIPADCLSYMYYRQALEHKNPSAQRTAALKMALEVAVSEKARKRVLDDLEGRDGEGEGGVGDGVAVPVPVVRMKVGEVSEANAVVVLPVCRAEERGIEVEAAPWECGSEGEFGVVVAEKGWSRWVVLPGWAPVVGLRRGGVAVSFADARALPWRANTWYKEEPILVVADRGRKEVAAADGFYLVLHDGGSSGLKVQRGSELKEMGVKESLGAVVLVVRPPREDGEYQMSDEEWD